MKKNLTGSAKAAIASQLFGSNGYDYLGNGNKDLVVWKNARNALVVGSEQLAKKASLSASVENRFDNNERIINSWLKAIRIHQWSKNILLFVPLLVAHHFHDQQAFIQISIAFISFSLCASATYLLNDLFDLESDRKHTNKQHRPLADGTLSIPVAIIGGGATASHQPYTRGYGQQLFFSYSHYLSNHYGVL